MLNVRLPAVAGRFYPSNPAELEAQITQMLDSAVDQQLTRRKALIVPHAGYIYSGPVAASAYQLLRNNQSINKVVLLGPAHYVSVRGLATSSAQAFESPLGSIPLDEQAIEMLQKLPQVECSDAAHAPEHCLEVQLPFLQSVLGDFKLIPLIVGFASPTEVAEVLAKVWGGDETLILISSDLSHYHDYETAQHIDTDTSLSICSLDSDLQGEQACGCYAVNGLLSLARARNMQIKQLDLRNSGDTAGDRARVVGYGAYALY